MRFIFELIFSMCKHNFHHLIFSFTCDIWFLFLRIECEEKKSKVTYLNLITTNFLLETLYFLAVCLRYIFSILNY